MSGMSILFIPSHSHPRQRVVVLFRNVYPIPGMSMMFIPSYNHPRQRVVVLFRNVYLMSGMSMLSMSSKAWFSPPMAQMKV